MGRGSNDKLCDIRPGSKTNICLKTGSEPEHYFTSRGLCVIPNAKHIEDNEIKAIASILVDKYYKLKEKLKEKDDSKIKPYDEDMGRIDPENFSREEHRRTAQINSLRTNSGKLFEDAVFSLAQKAYGATTADKDRSLKNKEGHDFNIDTYENDRLVRYQIECKSSDNWANDSGQMGTDKKFKKGKNKFKDEYPKEEYNPKIINVVLCRKGKTSPRKNKKDYYQLAGDDFWHFVTGDKDMRNRWLKALEQCIIEKEQAGKIF